jgi:hypothetical protein
MIIVVVNLTFDSHFGQVFLFSDLEPGSKNPHHHELSSGGTRYWQDTTLL